MSRPRWSGQVSEGMARRMAELRKGGLAYEVIARRFGVTARAVRYHVRKLGEDE